MRIYVGNQVNEAKSRLRLRHEAQAFRNLEGRCQPCTGLKLCENNLIIDHLKLGFSGSFKRQRRYLTQKNTHTH